MTAEPEPAAPDETLPEHLQRLSTELRNAARFDDVPARVLEAARGAWTWRLIDSELAELASQDRAVLRADPDTLATFSVGEVFIDVERLPAVSGETTILQGQVTAPTEIVAVEVELAGASPSVVPAGLDDGGGFRLSLPGWAPARLVVQLADGRRVVSSWLA